MPRVFGIFTDANPLIDRNESAALQILHGAGLLLKFLDFGDPSAEIDVAGRSTY